MKFDYYNLPFGAQLLIWTSRIVVNASCRNFPNKYELVDKAYKKVGLTKGLLYLKDLLSYLRNNKNFKLQSICNRDLVANEINLINCIEENKFPDFDNSYYIELWSIKKNRSEFCLAAQKLSISFKNLDLNTNIRSIKSDDLLQHKAKFKNITIH